MLTLYSVYYVTVLVYSRIVWLSWESTFETNEMTKTVLFQQILKANYKKAIQFNSLLNAQLAKFLLYWYWDIKCVNKRMKSSKSMETVCDDNDMRSIDR